MIFGTEIIIVIALIVLRLSASAFLDSLNAKNVRANSGAVPESFRTIVDEATYFKSVSYTLDKIKLDLVESVYGALILCGILMFMLIPLIFSYFTGVFGVSIWGQSLAFILTLVALGLPELPFEWYSQFVLEEKYGFNKSTKKLWVTDKIKGFFVGLVLGVPLMALILWFFQTFENSWWLLAFGALAAFQLLMMIIYPNLILPLFNKLTPLQDGELKEKLLAVSDRAGFKSNSIQVIDGSKRSSHSNAFFTGFGRFRRIVLFDTLIEQLSVSELEAVLAHEIGHYKKKHVLKMLAVVFASMFFMLWVVSVLVKSPWFYEGFGLKMEMGMAPVLMLFTLLIGLVTFWFHPLSNFFSRKHEYEADAFAKDICGTGDSLTSALRKLHTKNLGNLTPHKLYSLFYYSHPTLLEREEALRK